MSRVLAVRRPVVVPGQPPLPFRRAVVLPVAIRALGRLGRVLVRSLVSSVALAVVAVVSLVVWFRAADPVLVYLAAVDLAGALGVLWVRAVHHLVGGGS